MPSPKVIVFGPTGAVGSSAALTAASHGSHVVLAMRDTTKPIPGLSAADESASFSRIYADLTIPSTVSAAVTTSGAKHAFIYLIFQSSDHMLSTITALKEAGIELVVFLSSYTIQGPLEDVPAKDVIPYLHARVEINLKKVFGENGYVAVRPGYFASNTREYKAAFAAGKYKLYKPQATVDCIVPEDIGRVAGTVLVEGPRDGEREIVLYGPELRTQREVIGVLEKILGKKVEIEVVEGEDDAYSMYAERQRPLPVAKYMIDRFGKSVGDNQVLGYPVKEEELRNIEKYSERQATTFEAWVEQNRESFIS